ncbi:disulfide bond formation protein DsbA, partial [Nitrosopumilus sp. b3]
MDDFEFVEDKTQNPKIILNKSTFNKLIFAIVSVAIVSAFLGGYVVGGETAEPKEVIVREAVPTSQAKPTSQEQ